MASNLWFTSDSHFSHYNIIKYSNRPFESVQEMNERMIELWNERVRPQDHIYHLGDVSMCRPRHIKELMARLNGHKRLVRGNHDIFHTKEYMEVGWEEIYGIRVLENFIFTHIPIHPASMANFRANVHGHTHDQPDLSPMMKINPKTQEVRWQHYLNISVEKTNYHPISLEDIRQSVRSLSQID